MEIFGPEERVPVAFEPLFNWRVCGDFSCEHILAPQPGAIIEITVRPDLGFYRPGTGKIFLLINTYQDANGEHVMMVSSDQCTFDKMKPGELQQFILYPYWTNTGAFESLGETKKISLGLDTKPASFCRIIGHSQFLYEASSAQKRE